jgi:replication factor A1
MNNSSFMTVDPDISEAHALRGWFDAKSGSGQTPNFKSFSNSMGGGMASGAFKREEIRTLGDVKESGLGMGDTQEVFSARATIIHIKADNLTYAACPTCNKKAVEGNEGWHCEKCDRSYEKPEHRYMLRMSAADYSGQAWLSGFNDVAEIVFEP